MFVQNSFYSRKELEELGFRYIGKDVKISRKASFYGRSRISIGDYSRIDDFCILSGDIEIGRYVHVSASVCLFAGDAGIVMKDYSGISSQSAVYAESDDYSGAALSNAAIPDEYRRITKGKVIFERFTQLGAGSVVLPGVTLAEGSAAGSMSLVSKSLDPWTINVGIPCHSIKKRSKDMIRYAEELEQQGSNSLT